MDGDMRRAVLGREMALFRAEAPGFRTVFFPGRVYPALTATEGASAVGFLLDGLTSRDFDALDRYEEDEYERRPIEVLEGTHRLLAQTYWPLAAIPADSLPWMIEDWQRNHKARALVEAFEVHSR